jgi:hypothetical protein
LTRWGTLFPDLYAAGLGALVLVQATVHVRHLRNLFMFRNVERIRGRAEYPRGLMLRMSALEIVLFSALYGALSLLTGSVFTLGGALACAALSLNHLQLARRHEAGLARSG